MTGMNEIFMRDAIRLSLDAVRQGTGGPFGAVIVKDGQIVGRGQNRVVATHDPTAHAEVLAIREASAKLGTFELHDCELYTSCEPCPMCLAAIYWARIPRVYFANTQADAAQAGFDDAWLYEQFKLPADQRQVKLLPLLREEAVAACDEWARKPDKTPY
jgi:guanine deaminase